MSIAHDYSARNRAKKWDLFLRLIQPNKHQKILDVGFSDEEYSVSDNYLEKHYSWPENITALGVDLPFKFIQNYPKVRAIHYDGKEFPFGDKEFDLCWSNAVIEHVGGFDRQVDYLREIKRVSRKMFITTPNKYFPLEVHTRTPFLHYLPRQIFNAYLRFVGKAWAANDYMWLMSISDLRRCLKLAGINNYKIYRNRLAGLTLDYVVVANFD